MFSGEKINFTEVRVYSCPSIFFFFFHFLLNLSLSCRTVPYCMLHSGIDQTELSVLMAKM